jgi:hypothetical protein
MAGRQEAGSPWPCALHPEKKVPWRRDSRVLQTPVSRNLRSKPNLSLLNSQLKLALLGFKSQGRTSCSGDMVVQTEGVPLGRENQQGLKGTTDQGRKASPTTGLKWLW